MWPRCMMFRELQDEFAYESHQLTAENVKNGNICSEILPYNLRLKEKYSILMKILKSHIPKDNFGRFKPLNEKSSLPLESFYEK